MNPNYEKQLEAGVRRELEALGELPAPPALANRILQIVAERSAAPWYHRDWLTWPAGLRYASLTLLLSAFGALCFGTWELTRALAGLEQSSVYLADAQAIWKTLCVLGNVIAGFTSNLGTGYLVTALAALFALAAACIGLGSACFRLALRPAANGTST